MLNLKFCKSETFDDAMMRLGREGIDPAFNTVREVQLAVWRAAMESALGTIDTAPEKTVARHRIVQLRDAGRP